MNTTEYLKESEALAEKTGWPEWESGGIKWRLLKLSSWVIKMSHTETAARSRANVTWSGGYDIPESEAAVLWEHKHREWLKEKGIFFMRSTSHIYYVLRDLPQEHDYFLLDVDGTFVEFPAPERAYFDTIRSALIAAVKAVKV